jgi:hypothetical protein
MEAAKAEAAEKESGSEVPPTGAQSDRKIVARTVTANQFCLGGLTWTQADDNGLKEWHILSHSI